MTAPRCEILIVDKPAGMTSHDVVHEVRRIVDDRRVGHTGTLDPFATGVLVLCVGIATRLVEYMLVHDKRYLARVRLGETTDTYDRTGAVLQERPVEVERDRVASALAEFRGQIQQKPPPYSAIRVEGKRAHSLARAGKEFDLEPRTVCVHSLELLEFDPPSLTLDVACAAGVYVRSIAHDLGQRLGCGAHLAELRRTQVGAFSIDEAHTLDALLTAKQNGTLGSMLLPPERAFPHWPELRLDAAGDARVFHGHAVPFPEAIPQRGMCRIHSSDGRLFAIAEISSDGRFAQPRKVLR